MSAICQNFVQNAWKKELCSNCFKSKDEHTEHKPKTITVANKDIISIMKNNNIKNNTSKKKKKVWFLKDLSHVIGYGGEDLEENDDDEFEEDLDDEDDDDSDFTAESEEDEIEKELKRITKENTDFNSSLLGEEIKKPLMLGKPVLDSTGKKQTLLVTVTPFGEETPSPKKIKSHIPIIKEKITNKMENENNIHNLNNNNNKNNNNDNNNNKEKTLLEEITETLESNKNPIITKKKIQKDIVLTVTDNKENINTNEEIVEIKLQATKNVVTERKVGLTRTPALKRELDKPVYQTSTAKIELSTTVKKDKVEVKPTKFESREQAGEPDGRADPVMNSDPPALPKTSPPQLEFQTSFLHSPIYDKPKVPSKPIFKTEIKAEDTNKNNNQNNKRRAPMPPEENGISEIPSVVSEATITVEPPVLREKIESPLKEKETGVFARNSAIVVNTESPVVREKEKRERASSCSPKPRIAPVEPEPAPKPNKLSISTDNLVDRKEKTKTGRFSLKKFLRMGTKETSKPEAPPRPEEPPTPKPRLVIVHPLDFNKGVEVVPKPSDDCSKNSDTGEYETFNIKPARPPPPPRNLDHKPTLPQTAKPAIPHKVLIKSYQNGVTNKPKETVYANIGEVRSSIVPNKPQRTASMREREEKLQQQKRLNIENGEHVYDYINGRSSDESDSSPPKNSPTNSKTVRLNKRSESSTDVAGDYYKYSNIPRSMSLTYCGSETESEIYSPYSFYGSETEVTEDDHDWIQNGRTLKLRSRKGRSIVHKNLEDNYGAVVIANHEALAQVLENIQQQQLTHIQPALRGLKLSPNLRWLDFNIKPNTKVVVGSRIFHQALWGNQQITLMTSAGTISSNTLSLGMFNLNPITEFSDLIPAKYLSVNEDEDKQLQATVSVLPWMQVNTIQSYSESLPKEEDWKDGSFVLLQLVNALKLLQAQGIEELPLSLNSFILCKEDKDPNYRLCVLQGLGEDLNQSEPSGTLCACASKAASMVLPSAKVTTLIQSILNNERAVSLTQSKSVLEFSLWGPSDVGLGNTIKERELALQRWLDLQRATVLHGLVCTRVQLSVYEECHLMFLVRSTTRMMCDASLLLESSNMHHK